MAATTGVTRTPAQDRARKHIAQAMAEGWSIRKFAKVAGVGQPVASKMLRAASQQIGAQLEDKMGDQTKKTLRVAQRLRTNQTARAERIDALTEQLLADLEKKVADGGVLSGREVETLIKLQEKHWMHTKDMAGIAVAEKIAISQAGGEAQGAAMATTLIDATAVEIGNQVWMDDDDTDDIQEAVLIGD